MDKVQLRSWTKSIKPSVVGAFIMVHASPLCSPTQLQPAELRAGAAAVDITPPLGTQLGGYIGLRRPAQVIRDPLFARTVIYAGPQKMLCLLALDLILLTRPYCETIVEQLCNRFGFETDSILIHATQTHSAPALGAPLFDDEFPMSKEFDWLRLLDREYSDFVVDRAVACVEKAMMDLRPVQLGVLSAIEGRFAFNRRGITREGRAIMPPRVWPAPLGLSQLRFLEGPTDPELGVIATRDEHRMPNTVVVNYTCHPVHLFSDPGGVVSSDWPGVLCREIERSQNEYAGKGGLVALGINGACGDINPWDPYNPDYREDHEGMGRELATSTARVLEMMEFKNGSVLDCRARTIQIPLRTLESSRWELDHQLLTAHPDPLWSDSSQTALDVEWVFALLRANVQLQQQRDRVLDYEIKIFRIGDCALVGLPGEPFAAGGVEIKLASAARWTYIVHNVSQYAGYIPMKNSFKYGGHEVELSFWSKLVTEAWEMISQTTLEMLNEMFEVANTATMGQENMVP